MIIIAEYNNVIRVTEEAKINLMTWWSINIVDNLYTRAASKFYIFSYKKTLVRVINKHYDHSVKGIISEPTRRFPHIRVNYKHPPITCNRGIKP